MTSKDLRNAYIQFFIEHSHAYVPSASLVPENDPTTLFTSSGMQPLIPYLLGQKHPSGKRIVDVQKSFRSQDIEEVGDNRHTTFFEMLGNWSLGDYFKQEQLSWVFEFLTKKLKLDPNRLYVTVFAGNDQVSRDMESVEIWKTLFQYVGMKAKDLDFAERDGLRDGRIFYYGEKKNWWSRSGVPSAMPVGEPGGPDSEIFFDFGAELKLHENSPFRDQQCHVNCDCGRFGEIGNSVFMQYQKQEDGSFKELPQKNVDFGGGLERILAAVNDDPDVFDTDFFLPIIAEIEHSTSAQTKKTYLGHPELQPGFRVIADHMRAATMLAVDGVRPSNKEHGYVLRRLIRRSCVKLTQLHPGTMEDLPNIANVVLKFYDGLYVEYTEQKKEVIRVIAEEVLRFQKTLDKGLKVLEKTDNVDGKAAFDLYQTYGFPLEITTELVMQKGQTVDENVFREEFKKHQELSRTSSKGMFKGGLADQSEITTKYHTVTHLLHKALREVLGEHVSQQGSNITAERLRFDFSHPKALTEGEKQKVEQVINQKIHEDLPVTVTTMDKTEALASGAMAFFQEKYPDRVTVYTIGKNAQNDWFSKELCGGPHVKRTAEIGEIKITKEEAVGSGKRRMYVEKVK